MRSVNQKRAEQRDLSYECRGCISSCYVRINCDSQPVTPSLAAIGTHGNQKCGSPHTLVSGLLSPCRSEYLFTSLPQWWRDRRRLRRRDKQTQPSHAAKTSGEASMIHPRVV